MISIDNISFSYKNKQVINNFSLSITKNDRICIFGESGCGKTTLLRLILGLEHPQSGEITGLDILKPSVVFQENRLLPFKTILENMILVGADLNTANLNLKALGIAETANMYPSELSGGMQRRAAIARALSTEFNYLILDEALTGLDEANCSVATNHILQTAGERPIIMVTHSRSEAELFGARIVTI